MRQLQERRLTYLTHLARRFFAHLTAAPLTPSEQDVVAEHLAPDLRRLFYRQPVGDQRHAIGVLTALGGDATAAEAEAALLHDVGKHDVSLGAIGRSSATMWSWTGLPVWGSWRAYLEHGRRGADMLEQTTAT